MKASLDAKKKSTILCTFFCSKLIFFDMKKNNMIITKNTKLISIQQACEICSVSEKTIRRWIVEEKIKTIKFGKIVRIFLVDLNQFIGLKN
ncbi:MAG: helix-turn-helix domain-containing protein [Oscillospiraceae bacterium]|jgi:excisionase family DNA binding protein|nr:helix-turn-helix domain-containing protein [Oscillospiraceae bacterium]